MDVDEVIGQEREVTGEDLVLCDLCGHPVAWTSLVRLAGAPDLSEPVEVLRACKRCRLRIEQDDVPFDEEIATGLQAGEE